MATFIVRDLMTTNVKTLGRNDTLGVADDLMSSNDIRHAPVLDADGELCGILSQRDLFRGAFARALGYGGTAQKKLRDSLLVKEIMTTDVVTVRPQESLSTAARIMLEKKIGCLPVVDGGGRLIGILSESDFLKLAVDEELP
ncbi:MAG TPA: CBS domain-containing protein [Candidatus Binatia bacterium]|nr:CBS domain-containing protein [Candidatus Binatia bacterium]